MARIRVSEKIARRLEKGLPEIWEGGRADSDHDMIS